MYKTVLYSCGTQPMLHKSKSHLFCEQNLPRIGIEAPFNSKKVLKTSTQQFYIFCGFNKSLRTVKVCV